MNFNKFINSDYLKENPLCGIGEYKDTLDLATGVVTRKISRYVLTPDMLWNVEIGTTYQKYIPQTATGYANYLCSHFFPVYSWDDVTRTDGAFAISRRPAVFINYSQCATKEAFREWVTSQYNNGTPITVWYVLDTPTTETITVPSGLSGTEEGYLNQSGTPTPDNPIYPTANTVEKWFDINHYIMGTDTDTITTLPADIYANDTTATVGLKGNMEQSDTPTPTTPIQPQETGDRTGNLFNISTVTLGKYINASGEEATSSGTGENVLNHSDYIPINALTTYTFKCDKVAGYYGTSNAFCWFDSSKQLISRTLFTAEESGTEILGVDTAPAGAAYLIMNYRGLHGDTAMLNTGSTALPYEPYGVKIPILNNSQTTNVYLGEVESTRQIKKLVLTGNENISETTIGSKTIFQISQATVSDKKYGVATETMICSHYKVIDGRTNLETNDNAITTYNATNNNALLIRDDNCLTLTDFTTYLQQQYAAGTPVCIWYVLTTETTGIVNEPLRKIGTYADEVSGITIPTIAGADTLSVGTTLQPSEVTVNYKGWHPVADVHERENGQWD